MKGNYMFLLRKYFSSKRAQQKSAGVKSFAQITQGLKPYMGQ